MSKTALITGIHGQDGWYLAHSLREHGYSVTGTTHRPDAVGWLEPDALEIPILHLDMRSVRQIEDMIGENRFDEVYNLAARSSSSELFDDVVATGEINGLAVAATLDAIRRHSPETRFCQASTSEVFAGGIDLVLDERTPRIVRNAYGAAKAFADHIVESFRTAHSLFACSAILFSHESPRRPVSYLVRRVTRAAAAIAGGTESSLTLDNVASRRDWGYAPDYVEAMRLMLSAEEAEDFVIASGESHSVADVCRVAFAHVGLNWVDHVRTADQPARVTEPEARVGDSSKARTVLGWNPTLGFEEVVELMVDHDLSLTGTQT